MAPAGGEQTPEDRIGKTGLPRSTGRRYEDKAATKS
jgi:hypothetical protein